MFVDVLGVLEQLIATYAHRFLGSSYSTFTSFILRLRKHRLVLAQDSAFPRGNGQGLPAMARDLEFSTCDPIKALTHTEPC